jgi:hypothetical protein
VWARLSTLARHEIAEATAHFSSTRSQRTLAGSLTAHCVRSLALRGHTSAATLMRSSGDQDPLGRRGMTHVLRSEQGSPACHTKVGW